MALIMSKNLGEKLDLHMLGIGWQRALRYVKNFTKDIFHIQQFHSEQIIFSIGEKNFQFSHYFNVSSKD